jgi:hypothetical protein
MSTPNDGTQADVIAEWIRRHPEVWAEASHPLDPAVVDHVVADIVSGARLARLERPETSRRRRIVATGVLSTLVVAGGAVGVAALVRSGQPTQPTAGVGCRSGSSVDADVIVIEPTDDPVRDCAELWADGRFELAQGQSNAVPSLVACISDVGVIEVLPGGATMCAELGLVDAEPVLDPLNAQLVALEDRLVAEINSGSCMTAGDAASLAQQIIDEFGVVDWTVEARADSVWAECVKAILDLESRRIEIVKFP